MPYEIQNNHALTLYDRFTNWGASGIPEEVDQLMQALITEPGVATTRQVDFSLSLVRSSIG